MRLYHWKAPQGNFGDDMNEWFWDEVLPGWREWPGEAHLIGIGSLLTTGLPLPRGLKIVVGSGAGYGDAPSPSPPEDWDFRCVRGPRTAQVLGLSPARALTDAAIMTARMPKFAQASRTGRTLFVPHVYSDIHPEYDWPAICDAAGVGYLSPRRDSHDVIREIAGASLVLAESLHAAIVADTFRVPWRPVRTGVGSFKLFKWQDWTESMELPLEVIEVFAPLIRLRGWIRGVNDLAKPSVSSGNAPPERPTGTAANASSRIRTRVRDRLRLEVAARTLAKTARLEPFLSADAVLRNRLDRYQEVMGALARDYGTGTPRLG